MRAIKDGPFCWQSKAELRRIRDACDNRTDQAHVLAVYLALTWIASDCTTETFTERKGAIAERAGVSERKAADALRLLMQLGLVRVQSNPIEGTAALGPNTYTLCTTCATSGTERPTSCTDAKTQPCRNNRTSKKKPEQSSVGDASGSANEVQDSRHREITSQWGAAYREAYGCDYAMHGRDLGALKRFLAINRGVAAVEFLRTARRAWERAKADRFTKACKLAATIHGLCDGFNNVHAELAANHASIDPAPISKPYKVKSPATL